MKEATARRRRKTRIVWRSVFSGIVRYGFALFEKKGGNSPFVFYLPPSSAIYDVTIDGAGNNLSRHLFFLFFPWKI